MSMKSIFESHHVGTPFIERNYKAVLGQMEVQGKIVANPPRNRDQCGRASAPSPRRPW
jgi:hypothetical protein